MERNDLCWCGSGKKYKRCHIGEPVNQNDIIKNVYDATGKVYAKKLCMAKDHSCTGAIVKAHTVPLKELKKIAYNGHLYNFNIPYLAESVSHLFSQSTANISPLDNIMLKPIGINEASTFRGFCVKHDDEIFRVIEKDNYSINPESAFLFAYRAIVHELFKKNISKELFDKHFFPVTKSLGGNKEVIEGFNLGIDAAIKELTYYKDLADSILREKEFTKVKYFAIELDQVPSIMCSGIKQPTLDFAGNKIQDLEDTDKQLSHCTTTLISKNDRGLLIFVWFGEGVINEFIDSLLRVPEAERVDRVLAYLFESFENIYISPAWWDSLLANQQQQILNYFKTTTIDDRGYHTGTCPKIVTWNITNIYKSLE